MALQRIRLTVNGKPVEREVETRISLADFLRHDLSLTGTHVGCEHGVCGSCTVQYNGAPVRSCLMLAVQADQSDILTVEGLSENGALNSLQQVFKKHHALQCGFCTPGVLMTASALLRESGPLDDAQVRQAVTGHLCRCTGYQNIVNAIVEASEGEPQVPSRHEHAVASKFIGARVERAEDNELLTGKGVFVDDIDFPGMLHAYIVRSVHAHAKILRIDTGAAKKAPGVVEVITFKDLGAVRKFPLTIPHPNLKPLTEYPMADEKVRYVGEPVAVVVATSRHLAEDAAPLVQVEYEPMAPCVDIEQALSADAPLIHESESDNLAGFMKQSTGDVDRAFAEADHIIKETLRVHRGGCHAIETRGIVTHYEPKEGFLTIWASCQGPHRIRRTLLQLMDVPEHKVRVLAPRVGGGFGPKGGFYPENFLVPWLAVRLGTSVKWIEDRHEHFIASRQERDQTHWVEAAFNKDGKILALKNTFLYDTGAYSTSLVVPWITLATIPGPYKIPNLQLEFKAVYTNKVTAMVVRGAGRPQACYVMEKVMNRIARETGIDPAEVRRRNFIQKDEYPYGVGILYRDNNPLEYDSGNYPACLEKSLELIGYEDFRRAQLEQRKRGIRLGVGIAAYVEGTGFGPYEGGIVKVGTDGKIYVFTGAASQGQGQETALGQICADYLGVDFKNVHVVTGDSAGIPHGAGTFASRVMVTAGNAVAQASEQLRRKALELAANKLECRSEDLDLVNGEIFVKGTPEKKLTLRALANEAANRVSGFMVDRSIEPGLEATVYYSPRRSTHSNGVHIAVVKVDEETGHVEVQRYAVAHDCGTIINPMLVDGQIHGGVAHGIGNALYEEVIYDENGQILNGSYMDYYLPGAMEVPRMEVAHIETPTPLNPLGCKGTGEGGTIPAPTAVALAIEDALSDLNVKVNRIPVSPEVLLKSIEDAKGKRSGVKGKG
ncbi:MAG: molybdopterin-dependent oxidoreductase [Deltaproteobacteria bacterium]|nr:molybdopterin-dependent oxidoreductase [Deltaproteobacteria bacterium]MDZ4344528.1 molybdopterin-dependent oxidoreductase [Candidatus Binatia bacterium]